MDSIGKSYECEKILLGEMHRNLSNTREIRKKKSVVQILRKSRHYCKSLTMSKICTMEKKEG